MFRGTKSDGTLFRGTKSAATALHAVARSLYLRNETVQLPMHDGLWDCGSYVLLRRTPLLRCGIPTAASLPSDFGTRHFMPLQRTSLLHDGILCRCCSAARTSYDGILCRCSGLRCCTTAFYAAAARSSSADFVRCSGMKCRGTSYAAAAFYAVGLRNMPHCRSPWSAATGADAAAAELCFAAVVIRRHSMPL